MVMSDAAATAETRLNAYRTQYWFRLITILQNQFKLSCRLVGYGLFNKLALGYLEDQIGNQDELNQIGYEFPKYAFELSDTGFWKRTPVPKEALCELLSFDLALVKVFLEDAPGESATGESTNYPLTMENVDLLESPDYKLTLHPGIQLLQVHSDWIRYKTSDELTPQAFDTPQTCMIFRKSNQLICVYPDQNYTGLCWGTFLRELDRSDDFSVALEVYARDVQEAGGNVSTEIQSLFAHGASESWFLLNSL